MSLPRYQKYKASGSPWLADIPEQWEIYPLLSVASERSESNLGMLESNLLSLSYGRIIRKDISSNDGLLPESFETYQIVRAGDIVLRLTDLQNDKRSLRSAIVEEPGIITSAYLALKPRRIQPRFLAYLLRAYDLTKVFYSMGGGLRQSMKFADLKRMPVVVPSGDEQAAIATFLDRETAKIDALISEQEKLVALLAEKRHAAISQAVTRGLNPDAPMNDSGVAWLGEVPAHWPTVQLKYLCTLLKDGTHLPPSRVDDGIPLLSVRNINRSVFSLREDDSMISATDFADLCKAFVPQPDDVLMAIVGATLGKVAIVPKGLPVFHIQRSLAIFRTGPSVTPKWLFYCISSGAFQRLLWEYVGYSAQPGIYLGTLQDFKMPLPPLREQQDLCSFLDSEISKLETLRRESERTIDLLKERRSALITAAVMGQIDVRQTVNQSTEEVALAP
jgi:type I restriction enzyme S subunit